MRHPDPLVMWADVARVAAEHPELGEDLIHALQERLIVRESRQPTIDELRAYVDQVSSLGPRALRRYLVRPRATKGKRGPTVDRSVAPVGPGAEIGANETHQARSKGGASPGGGLTRDDSIDAAIEHRGPDGPWPTQTTVSLEPGKDERSRRIRHQVESDRLGYPTLEEIEAKRRALAAAGRPHGFDALGGKSTDAPFPGQRSTIRRRYLGAGLPPPGSWIPGICNAAPRHPHPRPT